MKNKGENWQNKTQTKKIETKNDSYGLNEGFSDAVEQIKLAKEDLNENLSHRNSCK